MGEWRNW